MPDPSQTPAINDNVAITRTQIASEARAARAESRAESRRILAIQAEERERRYYKSARIGNKHK